MGDCIFCKIANHEISTDVLYEDDQVLAFNDLNPQAPIHFLVIPKVHIESVNALTDEMFPVVQAVFKAVQSLAKEMGFDEAGYRVVTNCGADGGQTVDHLHYHVLAGRNLAWPPG
jgi:histidine triad (HIT) family protein